MIQSQSCCGTILYMAPEVINGNNFNAKADVYAFGILMFEVVTGRRAYMDLLFGKKAITPCAFQQKVIQSLRHEFKEGMTSKGLEVMIKQFWSCNPSEWPTIADPSSR